MRQSEKQPKGVGPRFHTRGRELWTWGFGGSFPALVWEFDSEEEAEHALMLSFRHDLCDGDDNPIVYDTREDAEAGLLEWIRFE